MTAQQVVSLLKEKALTVATAESCTAGLLSSAITAVSGASTIFGCGVSAYSAEIKHSILGVPTDVLEQYGTVSDETAAAMASGVRRLADSTIGVAITGVAGPNETEGKPVGRVHIAVANETRVWLRELSPNPSLSRENIRQNAVNTALEMIAAYAEAYPTLNAGSIPLAPPTVQEVTIPSTPIKPRRRFLSVLLPWKGDTVKEWILKSVCWLAVLCLLFAGGGGIYRLVTLTDNKSLYGDLQNMYVSEQAEHPENKDILSRFDSLYVQNADIGGWLRIDGTAINYPIMKNAGSDYYATHNFRQEYSVYGAPFFHKQNNLMSANAHNKVLIVYGNNTQDGQMFSGLTSYRKSDFLKQHSIVDMSTLYSANKWVVFGVMVLDPNEINAFDYTATAFENAEEFTKYVTDIEKRSLFKTDIDVTAQDNLLLLVTQAEEEYGFENATFVVVCRQVREGENLAEEMQVLRNTTVVMPRKWVYLNRGNTTKRTTVTTTTQETATTTTASTADNAVTTTETTKTAPPAEGTTVPVTDSVTQETTATTQTVKTLSE